MKYTILTPLEKVRELQEADAQMKAAAEAAAMAPCRWCERPTKEESKECADCAAKIDTYNGKCLHGTYVPYTDCTYCGHLAPREVFMRWQIRATYCGYGSDPKPPRYIMWDTGC